jgi:hypothetical protein
MIFGDSGDKDGRIDSTKRIIDGYKRYTGDGAGTMHKTGVELWKSGDGGGDGAGSSDGDDDDDLGDDRDDRDDGDDRFNNGNRGTDDIGNSISQLRCHRHSGRHGDSFPC